MRVCPPRLLPALVFGLLAVQTGQSWGKDENVTAEGIEIIDSLQSLSLRDVLLVTMARDPRGELAARYRAQGEALRQQAAMPYSSRPALTLRHQTDAVGSARGLSDWESNLELPTWRPEQRQATQALARSSETYAGGHTRALELMLAGEVRETLWQLVLAEERVKLARQARETAQALEREVGIRVKAGDLAQNNLLLARDETLSRDDEFINAVTEARHAAERYESLTGLDERPANFTETQSPRSEITGDHPLLAETQQRLERTQAQLTRVRSTGGEPAHLLVGLRSDKASTGEARHQSIGLGVRIPLDSKRFIAADIASAELATTEVQAEQVRLRRQLELTLHEAEHELATMRKALALAREQNTVVQETLRLARSSFQAGEMELAQLLRVQSRAQATERQLTLRLLQEQQAIARYNQAVGDIP